jgi:hypothetical protein
MPKIDHIPKQNVIGFAHEPLPFLQITPEFITYAQKHIKCYYLGDNPGILPEPFQEGNGYLSCYSPPSQETLTQTKFMSIMISQKTSAPGHKYRHELVSAILKTNLPIEFKVQDSISTPIHSENKMLMICNPPYGQRIKIDGKRGSFLKNAWDKFLTTDRPWRFAWVLPSDMDDLFKNPEGYILKNKRHLKNGGLAVTFWIWEKKD